MKFFFVASWYLAIPSFKKYLNNAPKSNAHKRTIPKEEPATAELITSPEPTPAAAKITPEPIMPQLIFPFTAYEKALPFK